MTTENLSAATAAAENADMAALQRSLIALGETLDRAVDGAPDAAAVKRITKQFAEVNARVTAVGRQLFAAQSSELSAASREVVAEIPRVEAALDDLARTETALAGLTGVLGLVDKALGIAKSAA